MRRMGVWCLVVLWAGLGTVRAEVKTWRVGDTTQPWNMVPVTGRLEWGRGWACEMIADDDGDGLIDEDPVELIDNDGDGLINEDPPDGFDNDYDGLIDEDGVDPQIDNDGDGRLNEDPAFTNGDDDYDGRRNCDPVDGIDNDGDGLVDEDGPRTLDGGPGVTTWLTPIRLDTLRNLALQLNERYLDGEFGGIVPGQDPRNMYMVIPSEYGYRSEGSDPVSADYFRIYSGTGYVPRTSYNAIVDGNLYTAFGSSEGGLGGVGFNLMGYYRINRVIFRPRPTLPSNTMSAYYIMYGDRTTINQAQNTVNTTKTLVAPIYGQTSKPVKDLRFDPAVEMGRIDIISLVAGGTRRETAEAGLYGVGYPTDAYYASEVIDVGTPTPRWRRYDRQYELFAQGERSQADAFFPSRAGNVVNWGKVRWRGRRLGTGGDVRLQFRAGNSLDTHIYARRLGPGLTDTRDSDGKTLDAFTWLKLTEGRVEQTDLPYNELGADIGDDGRLGWSYWTAPFKFEDGLIDESQPPEKWREQGIQLPLPGGTRYVQFRILFDSVESSACIFDYIEFDYDLPLVSGGVVAEVFPDQAYLGETTRFHYYLKPQFATGEKGQFNRIEIAVPTPDTRVDSLFFDFQPWGEVPVPAGGPADDPLAAASPRRVALAAGSADSVGQFAQAIVADPATGEPLLLLKVPPFGERNFRFGETLDIVLTSRLYRGSQQFNSTVWNDAAGTRTTVIPQPTSPGDATPEVASNGVMVVARSLGKLVHGITVSPNPFTPNGDGRNDEVKFSFDLYLLLDRTTISLEILDLAGRPLHRLVPTSQTAGRVELAWDGRDASGKLLPPGIYLYRLKIDSDGRQSGYTGTVALAY